MASYTERDLKLKNFRGKKFILKPRMSKQKEILKSKPKKFCMKKAYFLVHPNSDSFFIFKFSSNNKILMRKLAFSLHYKLR